MRRVLMVAFHFPPLAGSSGIQRTLRFAQHLPAHGWQPLVLSADPRAYERTSKDLSDDIAPSAIVRRAFALDTARHLSVGGRYIASMARPDRWISWRYDAVRQGLKLIKEYRPDVIWSTYPIGTAHVIGAELHRRTGLPWIADFRDPMAQDGYPEDALTWKSFKRIEEATVARASMTVFTTPSAVKEYQERYPEAAQRMRLLENGFDEETFTAAESQIAPGQLTPGAVTLLHSGIVYPSERDPTQLMAALRRLLDEGVVRPDSLRVRFRAPVADELVRQLAARHGVADFVELLPPVPYRDALAEMMRADGLLVMQASNCNAQIPAKLYEYFRCGRPILGLTDPAGDTAAAMRSAGLDAIARLDSVDAICDLLRRFLVDRGPSLLTQPTPERVREASRYARTGALSQWLQEVAVAG